MPQKRNPDAAELCRAKVGRITGALVALLTVMKGLPLAYSKDMQEDKEQVFDAADALMLALAAMAGMVADMAPQAERLRAAAGAGFSTATDLADWLVRRLGLPFREAHHVTGALVKAGRGEGRGPAGARASRRCRRCIRGFCRRFTRSWVWTTPWRVGQAMVARRRCRCSRRSGAGGRRSGERGLAPVGLCLALAALAACGIKGDPAPPEPEAAAEAS